MTGSTDQQQRRPTDAMKAFRQRYRRIDYRSSQALAANERVRAERPAFNTCQMLDQLVIEGERKFRKSATWSTQRSKSSTCLASKRFASASATASR